MILASKGANPHSASPCALSSCPINGPRMAAPRSQIKTDSDRRLGHLPYGVDARTPADLKAPAISADEFHHKVAELAKYGRVLVRLDVCHSGGVTGDGSALTSNADLLRSIIAASNVTVLTSRIR